MSLELKIKVCAVVVFVLACSYAAAEKHVICYYGTWATYRWGLGKFDVDDINPDLCTHAVYTFVGLDTQGNVISLDPYLDLPDNWGRNNFGAFNALKLKNPKLKTILAVGGWNEGSAKFSVMAASAAFRQNFISSAIKMMQDHGFDGLDVDWEYPNRRDTVHGQADVDNYTQLLRELRTEFDKHGFMLSAAVSSVRDTASLSYDIPAISSYLDLVNVMTYDMYGAWDSVTGHNAPLHLGEGDDAEDKEDLYTVDVALKYWLEQGAPKEKLVIGVPFYGRTFTLTNPSNTSVRAPASGAGLAGPFTATNGVIGYNEFCSMLRTESWTTKYDELAKVPYAYSGQNWVSYDNADSITKKIQYAMSYNISGIMIWSIETDDFHGVCGGGDFPLLRSVNTAVGNDVPAATTEVFSSTTSISSTTEVTSSTTEATSTVTSTSTTAASTTTDPCWIPSTTSETRNNQSTSSSMCTEEGLAPNPEDCSTFYMCVKDDAGSIHAWKFHCPNNLHWDQTQLRCDYPELVQCSS